MDAAGRHRGERRRARAAASQGALRLRAAARQLRHRVLVRRGPPRTRLAAGALLPGVWWSMGESRLGLSWACPEAGRRLGVLVVRCGNSTPPQVYTLARYANAWAVSPWQHAEPAPPLLGSAKAWGSWTGPPSALLRRQSQQRGQGEVLKRLCRTLLVPIRMRWLFLTRLAQ